MTQRLPPSGLASEVLASLPAPDPAEPQPIVAFVRAVAPPARAAAPAPVAVEHLVAFALADDLYTVPVRRVREIVRPSELTRIPQAPPHVRGVQNLRGAVLPVLEVRTRIGLPAAAITPSTRIIVAEAESRLVGLLVDAVRRVIAVPTTTIAPPPPEIRSQLSAYVVGVAPVDGRTSLLLDLEPLLRLPESGSGDVRE